MKRITFYVTVKDIINQLEKSDYVKIEFTRDSDFAIMDEKAYGHPDSQIYCLHFSQKDYDKCERNISLFKVWLVDNTKTVELFDSDGKTLAYSINITWS